jgi:hypothetical protein
MFVRLHDNHFATSVSIHLPGRQRTSSWSVLTLNIDHWFLLVESLEKTSLFRTFFGALDYRKRATTLDFQHVDRLVLNIGKPHMRVSLMPLRTFIWTYLHIRHHVANLHRPRFIVQACMSRVSNGDMPGWRLALDLKAGLDPVSDGLWRLGEAGGSLTVDRLFDSMDHIHANDDYESLWKHPIAHFKLSAYFNKTIFGNEEEERSEEETNNETDGSEEPDAESDDGNGSEDETNISEDPGTMCSEQSGHDADSEVDQDTVLE